MFDFLLYTAGEELTFGEKMLIGGQVTLLGMGTVFCILALLWGLVEVLHLILKPFSAPKTAQKAAQKPEAPAAETEEPAPKTDDSEIVAAIIAAISAATGKAPSAFRVVSFKRANRNFASK